MDMKKIKRFALLLIMASLAVNVQAQLEQAVKKIFAGDTVATHPVSLHRDSDSARVANLQKSLVHLLEEFFQVSPTFMIYPGIRKKTTSVPILKDTDTEINILPKTHL